MARKKRRAEQGQGHHRQAAQSSFTSGHGSISTLKCGLALVFAHRLAEGPPLTAKEGLASRPSARWSAERVNEEF